VATETRAECGHPPEAIGHGIIQRGLQNKIDGGAADVPEFAQHGGAVAHVIRTQFQLFAQGENDLAPARV